MTTPGAATQKHAVFLIPVLDRWLVFAPLHKVAAIVNHSAAQKLRSGDRVPPLAFRVLPLYCRTRRALPGIHVQQLW